MSLFFQDEVTKEDLQELKNFVFELSKKVEKLAMELSKKVEKLAMVMPELVEVSKMDAKQVYDRYKYYKFSELNPAIKEYIRRRFLVITLLSRWGTICLSNKSVGEIFEKYELFANSEEKGECEECKNK